MSSSHLHHYLSLLKPFSDLDATQKASILALKKEWSEYAGSENADELHAALNDLSVPQLEPYLVWIPSDYFEDSILLGQGGFAKVFKAIYGSFAAKEMSETMIFEVRSDH